VQGGSSPTSAPPPGSCRYVTRAEWGARPPQSTSYMGDNVPYVFIHHTAGAECNTTSACMSQMRGIQNYHMDSNGWADIGYSFLMGGDGNLYEGRGFNVQGAHTSGYNSVGYGVSFIGDFTSKLPTSGAQAAYFRAVNDCLLPQQKIKTSYQMYGHRQPGVTACPGIML
jgi:N-acetylmuramoyl-L-alanine amidase